MERALKVKYNLYIGKIMHCNKLKEWEKVWYTSNF